MNSAQHADASIFVIEQAPGLHFNRGALLNAAALFLKDSSYDCLVFHDVDTVCSSHDNVAYRCPSGDSNLLGILHLLHRQWIGSIACEQRMHAHYGSKFRLRLIWCEGLSEKVTAWPLGRRGAAASDAARVASPR